MLIRKAIKFMFGSRTLLITNVLTSGAVMGLGDWIVQQTVEKVDVNEQKIDWARTRRMTAVGFLFGPVSHVWYGYLDRWMPLANISTVLKKVLVDQAVAGPVFLAYFFAANGLLEGKTPIECWKEFRLKFLSIYMVECVLWPSAQVFNFYFLPPHLRVVYVCAVATVYDAFLSYMKYEPGSEALLIVKPKD